MFFRWSSQNEQADSLVPHGGVSVVIPIFNERDNIRPMHDALTRALASLRRPYEIVFVDDGSCDGSHDRLRDLAVADARVKLVRFSRNFGQTAALQAGLQYARGEYIVTMDGDQQNDPADIAMMLTKLDEGFDLVHGWRRQRQDSLVNRRIPSIVANWLIASVTRFPVHDLGCTLKAMRRDTARRLLLYGEMHRFIPILAHAQGARCVEVETRHHPRRFGTTKYGLGRTTRVLLDLLTVYFLVRHLTSPLKFFGRVGLYCIAAGVALPMAATAAHLIWDSDPFAAATWICATMLVLSGLHLLGLGLLGELGARIYFECQSRPAYEVSELINLAQATRGADHATPRAA